MPRIWSVIGVLLVPVVVAASDMLPDSTNCRQIALGSLLSSLRAERNVPTQEVRLNDSVVPENNRETPVQNVPPNFQREYQRLMRRCLKPGWYGQEGR